MAESTSTLAGPDLKKGIPLADLADGAMLPGHADGEAVLLARRGDEVFAIGATCTHYGGPLGEGLMEGETVRCPWHHACFSLRTGEALRAPALNPVPCWEVEQRDGRVVVTKRTERSPLATTPTPSRRASPAPRAVVIIGGGAAGNAAAEMLRREGYDGPLTVVDPDPDAPYDRPNLSKDYLAGSAPEEWIPLRPPDFAAQHGIEVVRTRATAIDARTRQVSLQGGGILGFDRLLIATGADPVRLTTPGMDQPHVHYLRSLANSRAIIAGLASAKQVVVVGSSFIGLEVAASLRARNIGVHVVAPDKRPLERVLGPEMGDFIRSLHEDHGVVFHLERTVADVHPGFVMLSDGAKVAADLVVVGVGVRPVTGLAEHAGLAMDRGVAVNEYLETSVPGIFAAGDIARWPDPRTGARIRVEHWVVAERAGQVAARNLLGAREPFAVAPFFWSAHYDVQINYVGHAEKWDRTELSGDIAKRDCVLSYYAGNTRLAVASIFRDRESLEAEVAMEEQAVTA